MANNDDIPAWMHEVPPGFLDYRTLGQDRFWLTADAVVVPLASASQPHLIAILGFLHARAMSLHMTAMIDAVLDLIDARAVGEVTAEQVTHDLTGESIASVDAHVWLESTPLVRAIRRELAARR